MRYMYRGRFSKGLNDLTAMGVTFTGRDPVEVRDAAAMQWFDGHPDYVRVAEEPAPDNRREVMAAALAAKQATKKPAKPRKPRKAKAKK